MSVFPLIFSLILLTPSVAFAITCPEGPPQDFSQVICVFIDLATIATPIVAGLALWLFFLGLQGFIISAGNEEAREHGKKVMLWGIISIFVMVSIWGILLWLSGDIFGPAPLVVPLLPTQ